MPAKPEKPEKPAKDHKREGHDQQSAAAEREAKIESLLLSGLDHYFASDYAQAIDVWTRALFLDRAHARARAYIERARSALGEQQRQSDELIHQGIAAFERGELSPARELLTAAVQRGGAHEVALAFLTRIDRVSAVPAAVRSVAIADAANIPATSSRPPTRRPVLWLAANLAIVVVGIAAGYVLTSWDQRGDVELAPVRVMQEPLIVPRGAEIALGRAKALFASGRLHDAIRAVDLVRPTDPLHADADKLKAAIQRELLALRSGPRVP